MDQGPRTLDQEPRTKDHGPCFGTDEHPRRDTDVILRQSKAPLELFTVRIVELIVKMIGYDETLILDLVLSRNRL